MLIVGSSQQQGECAANETGAVPLQARKHNPHSKVAASTAANHVTDSGTATTIRALMQRMWHWGQPSTGMNRTTNFRRPSVTCVTSGRSWWLELTVAQVLFGPGPRRIKYNNAETATVLLSAGNSCRLNYVTRRPIIIVAITNAMFGEQLFSSAGNSYSDSCISPSAHLAEILLFDKNNMKFV
jgi:hypothetical protein